MSDEDDRSDSWANSQTGLGNGRNARQAYNSFLIRAVKTTPELDNVYQFSALMGRIVAKLPRDSMAAGFTVTELSGDDVTALEDELTRLDALSKIADAGIWSRLYGGAVVYMQLADGLDSADPIDLTRIRRVQQLIVFERQEVQVCKWGEYLGSEYYGRPEQYDIYSMGQTFRVHASRILHFDGIPVSRRMARQYRGDGFGQSVVDQVWDAFEQYGTTHSYLADAITRITQGVVSLKGLTQSMSTAGGKGLRSRLQALAASMSVLGDIAIDADGEKYEVIQRPVTGFGEAAGVFADRLVAETGIPKSILLGITPGGLNSGGNSGDWQAWSTVVGDWRRSQERNIRRLLQAIFAQYTSPIETPPRRLTITWPSIMQPTDSELAAVSLQRAQARASDVTAGIVSPMEARASDDVVSTYRTADAAVDTGPGDIGS